MKFANPLFLYALFLLIIPVIIHLFHFRKFKKLYFPNIRFLQDIRQSSSTKNKIKHLLVLFSRLFFITALVLAFAQPFFPKDESIAKPGTNAISIYIDNSFSMTNTGTVSNLLEEAKLKAEEIVETYKESDVFQIITNDLEIKHNRFVNKDEFISFLAEVSESPASRNQSMIINRQTDALLDQDAANFTAFIISDFQKSTSDLESFQLDTSVNYTFVPVNAVQSDNVYIDTVWFSSPVFQLNKQNEVNVKIVNSSQSIKDGTVNLRINNTPKSLANYDIEANNHQILTLPFTITESGWNNALVSIEDFPVTFDDDYFFVFQVKEQIDVLTVNGRNVNRYLDAVFKTEEFFRHQNINAGQLDVTSIPDYGLVILNELENISSGLQMALTTYIEEGGSVFVIPPSNDNINFRESYRSFLTALQYNYFQELSTGNLSVTYINLQSPVFTNVFEEIPENVKLPEVNMYYRLSRGISGGEHLLTFRNNDPFLSYFNYGSGNVFLLSTPLDREWTNLTNHALFVPLIYNIALYSERYNRLSFEIGSESGIEVRPHGSGKISRNAIFSIKNEDTDIIPPQRTFAGNLIIFPENFIQKAGIYNLIPTGTEIENSDDDYLLAFNYNRSESELDFYSYEKLFEFAKENNIKVLKTEVGRVGRDLSKIEQTSSLWKWFIWVALLFLLLEIFLLKFRKK